MCKFALVLPCLAWASHARHMQSSYDQLPRLPSDVHVNELTALSALARVLLTSDPAAAFGHVTPGILSTLPKARNQELRAGTRTAARMEATVAEEECQDEDAIRADAETAFRLLDLDGDGSISDKEFKKYLLQYGYTTDNSNKIWAALDSDANGEISLEELREGLVGYCRCNKCETKFESEVRGEADELFDVIDLDGDGKITCSELQGHLRKVGYTEKAVATIFQSLDENQDGDLTREEMQAGFLKYSMLREAMDAVVKELVRKADAA